jgi:hypothetical protein
MNPARRALDLISPVITTGEWFGRLPRNGQADRDNYIRGRSVSTMQSLIRGSGPRMQSHLVNALCKTISAESKRTDFALAA